MEISIKIPSHVGYIIDTLICNGFEAYIVGGCVRDSILNIEPKDWDITTNAKPNDVIKLFDKVILTGVKHGTVTVLINNEHYEVTTYRIDGVYEDNRHPKEVKFVTSLKEDLARRDFTINAMAYNLKDGLIDYFNGVKDLNNKVIKTVGAPEKRFTEDALRMLRAVRFSAQLDFNIDDRTLYYIKCLKDNIKNISKERIREEFNKILLYNPQKIDILRQSGILDFLIPEIKKVYSLKQNNSYHIYDLYDHTICAIQSIPPILHLRLTMLLHDFGKIYTETIDEKGISHYNGHPKESVKIGDNFLRSLKYDNTCINKVLILIQYHDCTLKSKLSIKRMLNKIGYSLLIDLICVKKADILAQNPKFIKERIQELSIVEQQIALIVNNNECFNLSDLRINGKDLLNLGFEKGKIIGETLQLLLDMIIEEPELNKNEILIDIAKKLKTIK